MHILKYKDAFENFVSLRIECIRFNFFNNNTDIYTIYIMYNYLWMIYYLYYL